MIPSSEVEELARYLCGISEDDEQADIDDALDDKFGVDMCAFEKIVNALTPMITVAQSGMTLTTYRGFADKKSQTFLVKQPVLGATGEHDRRYT